MIWVPVTVAPTWPGTKGDGGGSDGGGDGGGSEGGGGLGSGGDGLGGGGDGDGGDGLGGGGEGEGGGTRQAVWQAYFCAEAHQKSFHVPGWWKLNDKQSSPSLCLPP